MVREGPPEVSNLSSSKKLSESVLAGGVASRCASQNIFFCAEAAMQWIQQACSIVVVIAGVASGIISVVIDAITEVRQGWRRHAAYGGMK